MKKILIATGGSGGHVIPSLSIYDALKDDFEVKFQQTQEDQNSLIMRIIITH